MSDQKPYLAPPQDAGQQPVLAQPAYASPVQYVPEIAGAARTLGICYIVLGVLAGLVLLGCAVLLPYWFRTSNASDPASPPPLAAYYFIIAIGLALASVLPLVTGMGLLNRASWGRMCSVVNAALILLSFPFGTTLGGFTLYFMLRSGAREAYARYAAGSI